MKTAAVATMMLALMIGVVACGGPRADTEPEVVGHTWQWQRFVDTAGENNVSVPDPENYTLMLAEDGTASIQADCNQVSWTYTLESSALRFDTEGPSTLAFCSEESLDQEYLRRLGSTATYVIDGGTLYLNLIYDSGNMEFTSAE